jgi:hypothetical protein
MFLESVDVSESCLEELPRRTEFFVAARANEMSFDTDNNLFPLPA